MYNVVQILGKNKPKGYPSPGNRDCRSCRIIKYVSGKQIQHQRIFNIKRNIGIELIGLRD